MTIDPRGEPDLERDGATNRDTYNGWVVEVRDKIADAAKAGRWTVVLEVLEEHPTFVNASRIGGTSRFAPLHQAAHLRAPLEVIDRLIALGAWRTLRTARAERAVDIALRNGAGAALLTRLEPVILCAIAPNARATVQQHLRALIRQRAEKQVVEHQLRLPELEPLGELLPERRIWFPVPGMHGGFSYWLGSGGDHPVVITESWCRVVGGSGERHRIGENGIELLEAGFV